VALTDDFGLTQDGLFLRRVQMAIVSTALAVQSEATSTANHAARSAFALAILANPPGYAQMMASGMSVDGATSAASTDAQLETRASAIFNAYCVQG
jgi:hypothetical protein